MFTSSLRKTRALHTSLLGLATLLSGAVSAQERRAVPTPEASAAQPAQETMTGGEVRHVAISSLADSIPLPGDGIRYEETPNGVREILPAESDPNFLGFVAGNYYPPADERVDPLLRKAAAAIPFGREDQVTYGFAMFSKRMTRERIEQLEAMGATFLAQHPHYAAKLAIPPHAIDAIADLDFIRWIGVPREWQKLQPELVKVAQRATAEQELDVWISVYSSDLGVASAFETVGQGSLLEPETSMATAMPLDAGPKRWQSNGWQHEGLTQQGAEIREYADSVTAFRARLTPALLVKVAALDYVQFVELDIVPELAHDESQPMCGVDIIRPTNTGGTFGDAILGEADSGIEASHFLLNHVFGMGWDLAGTTGGPWDDQSGHGTHVGGTIFGGSWLGNEAMYGAAPGLGSANDRRIYNVKIFDDNGTWGGTSLQTICNIFNTPVSDGSVTTPIPHIISNSWGGGSGGYFGSETDCRILDSETYFNNQLYVFAAGNNGSGAGTMLVQSSAKNVLSIGSVNPYRSSSTSPDDVSSFSSRGPCGDGRWKPNLCAPGSSIDSADSGDFSGFTSKSGTSMATPHVAGIAATVVDRHDFLQYNPSTLSAVLMASALSPDLHTWPSDSHLDNYGAGRISAYRAIGSNSNTAMFYWGYLQDPSATAELDFTVGANATRVTVVMTYHEIAASSGASQALVNDIDCYIDRAPFTGSGNTGDWFNQISHIDNTEMRTLNNPSEGSYKVKTFPNSVSAFFRPKVGVCVIVDYGDLTPTGTLSMSSSDTYVQPGDSVEITGSVTNPSSGSVAQSVYLDAVTGGMSLASVQSQLADGAVSELTDNVNGGTEVMLGDMRQGQSRSVTWSGAWNSEGTKTFTASTLSPTMNSTNDSVQVVVDGTAPGLPPGLQSTDHTAGAHSCDLTVAMDWNPASDSLSGVEGYSYAWSHSATTTPDASIDTSATSSNTALSASSQGWWFHVRAIDRAGNAGGTAHAGPYFLGEAQVTSYCNSNQNSTGQMGLLDTLGPVCLANGQLTLRTVNLPLDKFGYYFMGEAKANVPFFGGSQGVLCVGAPIIRFSSNVLNSGATGTMTFTPDMNNLPGGSVFSHGSVWNFQLWYRDNNPGTTSNTSNGIEVIWD